MMRDNNTNCILTMAKNFEPNKIQFGVGVVSINWLTLDILERWINKPAYKKVQIFIANVNGAPASSILHVLGNVAVPKIFPNSKRPTKFRSSPTITIEIKGQLFIMYTKSIFERRHNKLNLVLFEKLNWIFGKLILVIPPKLDFINLTEDFFLNENVNAFWLKVKSLYIEIKIVLYNSIYIYVDLDIHIF